MLKIRILNQRFFTGEKTVVCKLACEIIFPNRIPQSAWNKLTKTFENVEQQHHKVSTWNHTFDVEGIAKCSDNDDYSQLTGKRIAEARAFRKAYKIGKQVCSHILTELNKEFELYEDSYYKFDNLINNETDNIDDLSY